LPHFLQEQSDQRAGRSAAEPAEDGMDAHIQEALRDCPDENLCEAQKTLVQQAQNRVERVAERHEEMIKPFSKSMKKKFDQFVEEDKKHKKLRWCQQMSFDSQVLADRFLKKEKVRWMASGKKDRDTIHAMCDSEVGQMQPAS